MSLTHGLPRRDIAFCGIHVPEIKHQMEVICLHVYTSVFIVCALNALLEFVSLSRQVIPAIEIATFSKDIVNFEV